MRRTAIWLLSLAVCLSLALAGLAGPKKPVKPEDTLARAAFRDDVADRIRSDGTYACDDYHYVDSEDTCNVSGDLVVSKVYGGGPLDGQYFLRTIDTKAPQEDVQDPTRWLVLDFTDGLNDSSCQALDTKLQDYEGKDPEAFPPEDPNQDPCIDWVEVRFAAHKAFKSGAQYTTLGILIDGPDLMQRGKKTWTAWNAKWLLEFVNPLVIEHPDPDDLNTVILSTMDGLDQAELWTLSERTGEPETLVGTYSMPFEVTITKLP